MGDEGYKTNETSEEGSRNYIDFYVEKAIAFGGHNVVNKNKILDMLLSGPRFMGRIPSERNGAVSGNSSSRYLDAECEVHLSRIASTDSKSVTKLQKETEITRKVRNPGERHTPLPTATFTMVVSWSWLL